MPRRKKKNRPEPGPDDNSDDCFESQVTGVVKQYTKGDSQTAHGFIAVQHISRNVFFHISAVSRDTRRPGDPIRVGDEVMFDLYRGPNGYRAESVQIFNPYVEDFSHEKHSRRKNSESGSSRPREGNGGGAGGRGGRRRQQQRRSSERDRSGCEWADDHGNKDDDGDW